MKGYLLCFTLLLNLEYFQLHAQKNEAQLLNYQADSLSYCGYFDQEMEVRNKLISISPAPSSEYQKQQILLKIAEYNLLNEKQSADESTLIFKSVISTYQQFPQREKRLVAVEVGRLIALKLIELERTDEGISLFKKLLKRVKKNSVDVALLNLNIGQTLLNNQRKYYESIAYFKEAIAGFEANGMSNHYANALAYSELSFSYDRAEVENLMFECSEKALEIWNTYYFKDTEIVSTAYNNMIADMVDYGDHFAAQKYQTDYEKYIGNYLESGKSNYLKKSDEFSTLGLFYLTAAKFYSFEFDSAKLRGAVKSQEQLFSKAPAKWKEKELNLLLSTYDSASYGFYMNSESEEALRYNAIMEQNANDDFYLMKAEANRAMLFYYKYDYLKALNHTEKSLAYLELLGYRSSYKTLLTLKAELLANLGRSTESKKALDESFKLQFDDKFNFKNLKIADYEEVASSSDINILIHSGLAYRAVYEKSGKGKHDLAVMKNFYWVAAQMFQRYYLKGFFNPDLERQLNNIKEGLFFGYVENPTDKNYLARSVNIIENNSSQHLWKQFVAKHGQNLNIPKGLLSKRNEVSMELTFVEGKDELTADETKKLAKLKADLQAVEEEMNNENPNYKRFAVDTFDINELQQSDLLKKRALVKFAVTDSSVFAYKISPNTSDLVFLGKRNIIEKEVKVYYEKLRGIDFDYKIQSKKLYELLLEPLRLSTSSKLTFVTEGFLNYLPFEALLAANNGASKIPTVSYANSLKFVFYTSQKNVEYFNSLFSGFAPEYSNKSVATRAENGQLVYTGKELSEIAGTIGKATVFVRENATKKNFVGSLGESKIHHLAMHSLLNEADYNYSSLVFQNDEKLYFYELYNLNFPSEMVVLSACNTGIGQYLSGEGLMSMSKALNYAGVKSTVYSLWQVPDKETSELMVFFYQNIERGLPKDEALAAAKQEFMEKFPAKSHPYYWAGFVLNGDVSAIKTATYWWSVFGGILLLVVVFFFVRKKILN
jgi:CHAT domain-containing protein